MITGEIKSRIDAIWDTFFAGGITNPMTVLEQMTYLFFMKMLDDAQKTKEAHASIMGVAVKEPTFKEGMWHNPDIDKEVPYESLRWSVFKNKEADGFSLDDKRNPVAESDIPDIVHRFHHLEAEADRTRKDASFLVPVEEIREKGYDLSINKYKEIEREKVVYESSEVLMNRIEGLETQILQAFAELKKMI